MKKLEEKIIEANPDIMEVDFELYSIEEQLISIKNEMRDKRSTTGALDMIALNDLHNRIENKKIIGRPITLEDVLIALDKIEQEYDDAIGIDTNGNIFKGDTYTGIQWQLGKPLDSQPKEVIDFLKEILL